MGANEGILFIKKRYIFLIVVLLQATHPPSYFIDADSFDGTPFTVSTGSSSTSTSSNTGGTTLSDSTESSSTGSSAHLPSGPPPSGSSPPRPILYHCIPIKNRGYVAMCCQPGSGDNWYYFTNSGNRTKVTTEKYAQRMRKSEYVINWTGTPSDPSNHYYNFIKCGAERCANYCGLGPFTAQELADAAAGLIPTVVPGLIPTIDP